MGSGGVQEPVQGPYAVCWCSRCFFCALRGVCPHVVMLRKRIERPTIHGRAYFPGDVPARKSDVIARDTSGRGTRPHDNG